MMRLNVFRILPGLAEWHEPNGGMFLWLKIIGLKDTREFVHSRCLDKLLILAPGYALSVDSNSPSPYIRVSYSIASPEDVERVHTQVIFFLYAQTNLLQLTVLKY